MWAHPDDRSVHHLDLAYWCDVARRAEAGGLDGIFIADALGQLDVYGGSPDAALRTAVQSPLIDPLLVVPAMAAVTSHIGFGITMSATYEHPYQLARRFSTLDHLTKGRIAWNVVTSSLDSAAHNFGFDHQIPHDERYERAQEFIEVCYKLWEGSWEDDAVVADPRTRVYVDPAKVHRIDHEGSWFRVPGPHLCQPSRQRTPVIYQAGASPRGVEFAATNAELVFLGGGSASDLRGQVARVRAAAARVGRAPDAIRFITAASVVTAARGADAHAKYADLQRHADPETALVLLSSWTGTDWSSYPLDEPLAHIDTDAGRSTLATFTGIDSGRVWTLREVATYMGFGGNHPRFVGSGEEVAAELVAFADEAGLDGYAVADALSPGTLDDFVAHVMPALRARGLVAEHPTEPTTLRERSRGWEGPGSHRTIRGPATGGSPAWQPHSADSARFRWSTRLGTPGFTALSGIA